MYLRARRVYPRFSSRFHTLPLSYTTFSSLASITLHAQHSIFSKYVIRYFLFFFFRLCVSFFTCRAYKRACTFECMRTHRTCNNNCNRNRSIVNVNVPSPFVGYLVSFNRYRFTLLLLVVLYYYPPRATTYITVLCHHFSCHHHCPRHRSSHRLDVSVNGFIR